jgi:hypothetical protein
VAQSESLTCAKETSMRVIEWSSGEIHRVVRSTLAAEAASASHAHDRGTFARVLLAELLFAQTELPWTEAQRAVKYGLASDCSSLVDHCQKTGSSVSEKRVGLDIADVRAAVDAGDTLCWVPTRVMPADCLTKHLVQQPTTVQITEHNRLRIKWNKQTDSARALRVTAQLAQDARDAQDGDAQCTRDASVVRASAPMRATDCLRVDLLDPRRGTW